MRDNEQEDCIELYSVGCRPELSLLTAMPIEQNRSLTKIDEILHVNIREFLYALMQHRAKRGFIKPIAAYRFHILRKTTCIRPQTPLGHRICIARTCGDNGRHRADAESHAHFTPILTPSQRVRLCAALEIILEHLPSDTGITGP